MKFKNKDSRIFDNYQINILEGDVSSNTNKKNFRKDKKEFRKCFEIPNRISDRYKRITKIYIRNLKRKEKIRSWLQDYKVIKMDRNPIDFSTSKKNVMIC